MGLFSKKYATNVMSGRKVERLLAELASRDWNKRLTAIQALGKLGDNQATQALIKALSDDDIYIRVRHQVFGKVLNTWLIVAARFGNNPDPASSGFGA